LIGFILTPSLPWREIRYGLLGYRVVSLCLLYEHYEQERGQWNFGEVFLYILLILYLLFYFEETAEDKGSTKYCGLQQYIVDNGVGEIA
jgi:hypothetical protein